MAKDDASYQVKLDMNVGRDPQAMDESRVVGDGVFRLAVCGDFRGRSGSAAATTGSIAAWRVDRDDFDDVLASVAPTLRLALGQGVVAEVRIRELDDFHPDQLFLRVPQFAPLRDLRERLADPSTFKRAAAELSAPPAPRPRPVLRASGSLLDAIVGEDSPSPRAPAASDDLYEFIQRSMAPYLEARPDPRQAELLAEVDESIAAAMRTLMHHPGFQAVESLWRGVFRLVRQVDTDERLQVHLVDVTREELVADLLGAPTPRDTALFRRLTAGSTAGQGGWGVLVAHQAFGADDVAVLERLAGLGSALDAPWLGEAHPDLATGSLSDSAAATWGRLRGSPAARYLGLALPRVLLRAPYGKDSDATEGFSFEELESPDAHGSYLWGSPALVCATLLAEGFAERGEGLAVGASSLVEGLPMHVTRKAGETTVKPCAEVVMSESDAIALIESGFIPMLSYRDQNVVRVSRMQCIAEPPTRLAGSMAR